MNRSSTIAILSIVILALGVAGFVLARQEKLLPSQALAHIAQECNQAANEGKISWGEEFRKYRAELSRKALAEIDVEGLSGDEKIDLAQLMSWAGENEAALEMLADLMSGEGIVAQKAAVARLKHLASDERLDQLETGIAEYHQRFRPNPALPKNLSDPVDLLAKHYAEQGEHRKVVDLVLDEVNSLDYKAPYESYYLLYLYRKSFIECGEQELVLDLTKRHGDGLMAVYNERSTGSETQDDEFQNITEEYRQAGLTVQLAHTQLSLIGQPAPEFSSIESLNAGSISLEDFNGKVVLLDFWTNWCSPCKAAFPHVRGLYAKYKNQGLVILGVTDFQGWFRDGKIVEQEIDRERELKLTKDLIEKYDMTWPTAMLEKDTFMTYGIREVPSFVVIDRHGVVRLLETGLTAKDSASLEELVQKLLAEE